MGNIQLEEIPLVKLLLYLPFTIVTQTKVKEVGLSEILLTRTINLEWNLLRL